MQKSMPSSAKTACPTSTTAQVCRIVKRLRWKRCAGYQSYRLVCKLSIRPYHEIEQSVGGDHCTLEDDEYKGYFIPKGTVVFGNVW